MSTAPPSPGYFSDAPATPGGVVSRGLIGHVRIVALLNAGEGVLELTVAGVCLLTGGFMLLVPAPIQQQGAGNPAALSAVYFIAGFVHLVLGSLRVIAAWRNYSFHNRSLGIVSLCAGLVSTFAGCCALTSLAIAIYGLIVLFDAAVMNAFERRAQGASIDELLLPPDKNRTSSA